MDAIDKFNRTVLTHHLCGKSLKELFNINPELPWNDNQRQVVNTDLISFYRLSLQYMFVAEFCKLITPIKPSWPDTNISSLYQLNNACLKTGTFETERFKNDLDIAKITNNKFSIQVKTSRDQQLLHSDAVVENPGLFKGYTLEDIKTAKNILDEMLTVINRCGKGIGIGTFDVNDVDNSTQVFIGNHAKIYDNPLMLLQDFFVPFPYNLY
jgi:hypothetical protein